MAEIDETIYGPDRMIDSTENNEYMEGFRDETLIEENIVDINIPEDDEDTNWQREANEIERPLYNETGLREDI